MIQFQFPELFLLAIPLAFAYRRWGTAMGGTEMLRFAACLPLQCDDDLQQGRARIRNGSAESAQRVAAVWLAA